MRFLTQQFGYWGYAIRRFLEENQGEGSSSEAYGGYSAIVYIDGSSVIARDYKGNIIASGTAGTDDASVINNAFSNLTGSRTWREKVKLIGSFALTDNISIPSYTIFDAEEAKLTLAASTAKNVIEVKNASYVDIIGGIYDGNRTNQSESGTIFLQNGIWIQNANHVRLYRPRVISPYRGGIIVRASTGETTSDIWIYDPEVYDFLDNGATQNLPGIFINGQNGTLERVYIVNPYVHDSSKTSTGPVGISNYYASKIFIMGGSIDTVGDDCLTANNVTEIVISSQITTKSSQVGHGVQIVDSSDFAIIGVISELNNKIGIYVNNSSNGLVSNCIAKNNGQGGETGNLVGIGLSGSSGCSDVLVIGNRCYDDQANKTQATGINEYNSDYNIIIGNDCRGNKTHAVQCVGAHTIVKDNQGYVNENEGSATITSGNTSVTVNHGLVDTPTNIQLTGTHSEVKDAYVTNPGATSFTIQVDSAVSADRVVHWKAKV